MEVGEREEAAFLAIRNNSEAMDACSKLQISSYGLAKQLKLRVDSESISLRN